MENFVQSVLKKSVELSENSTTRGLPWLKEEKNLCLAQSLSKAHEIAPKSAETLRLSAPPMILVKHPCTLKNKV